MLQFGHSATKRCLSPVPVTHETMPDHRQIFQGPIILYNVVDTRYRIGEQRGLRAESRFGWDFAQATTQ